MQLLIEVAKLNRLTIYLSFNPCVKVLKLVYEIRKVLRLFRGFLVMQIMSYHPMSRKEFILHRINIVLIEGYVTI